MKKKKVLGMIGAIVLIIVILVAVFIAKDLRQESELMEEIADVEELMSAEEPDMDSIYERLNRTVTTGDYAVVENAVKQYISDNISAASRMVDALEAEEIRDALTADNYQTDGPDFVKTKLALSNIQDTLTETKEQMLELTDPENTMSYLSGDLDSYYVELYQEIMGDESVYVENTEDIEKNVDELIRVITVEQETLDFLSAHKGEWEMQDGQIAFANDELTDQYNELVLKLE